MLSGLLVSSGTFSKPGLLGDFADALSRFAADLRKSEADSAQHAPARSAEIPGLAEMKAQTYSDLNGLPIEIKRAICSQMERLAQISPVIKSSFDGVERQGKNLCHAATYQALYGVIDGRLKALCPNNAGVRQATLRSLLGNLNASLNNMNGLDGQKIKDRKNFDINAIDEVIRRNKSRGVLPDLSIKDAPPTYFEAIKVAPPVIVKVQVNVAVHGAPPAYPGQK